MGKHVRGMQWVVASVLSLGLLFALVGTASAHATPITADPGMGATIKEAPTKVTITTTENMNPDPKKSYLEVYAPDGALVSQGDSQVPLNNPRELSVTIKPKGNGIYIVRWFTTSADDNDAAEGAFLFTVNPKANTAPVAPTSRPATTSGGAGGVPLWVPIVAALVALLVGLGGGIGIGRRRVAPSSLGALRRAVKGQGESEETLSERS